MDKTLLARLILVADNLHDIIDTANQNDEMQYHVYSALFDELDQLDAIIDQLQAEIDKEKTT